MWLFYLIKKLILILKLYLLKKIFNGLSPETKMYDLNLYERN